MEIVVAMSGGVDSAVTAALLLERGHSVAGATMSIWREGRYRGGKRDACFGPGEREDIETAEKVCRRLGIPHRTLDCVDAYEKIVLNNFRSEYLAGRTPNPCVRCNSQIKFAVLSRLAEAAGMSFERFATGHYVRLAPHDGLIRLYRGREPAKDQSYFLYRLDQEQLARVLTPLGDYAKDEVRAMARRFSLPVHDKPDSQDFYAGDYRELLDVEGRPGGPIVHASGKILGQHDGYWNFTVGQRKGLGLSHCEPLYVIAIHPERNEVIVGETGTTVRHWLIARDCNWVSIPPPEIPFNAGVKVRSSGAIVSCRVVPLADAGFQAEFPDGIAGVAPGQSAVLYQDDMLLGGGVIVSSG
jgi:tRNA-specific 2-thiouridylase